jgi:hypothetical protein
VLGRRDFRFEECWRRCRRRVWGRPRRRFLRKSAPSAGKGRCYPSTRTTSRIRTPWSSSRP